ncbi:hypothetical protein HZI73_17985 [Vallitalea pronyensis]|uniref:DNA mismatch repair proteins mutS family domain-containing protein n=1 Tax=Vallitalea pronyensis TaxID=1348613 RepID=A0A8J8MMD3_9FIRM|nr:hypothetical protein [Vallitalea pronyensis]QUI24067.1 hypothetical protein HZI73_17985 [Vallitalea pronyensis]
MIIQAMDKRLGEDVGLPYILDELRVISPYGKYAKSMLQLYQPQEKACLIKALNDVETMMQSLLKEKHIWTSIETVMAKLKDVKLLIKNFTVQKVLDDVALFEIKHVAMLMEDISAYYKQLTVSTDIRLTSMKALIDLLDPQNKGIQSFYIYDHYDPELSPIRKEKIRIEKEIFAEDNPQKIEVLKEQRLALVVQEDKLETAIRKQLSAKIYAFKNKLLYNMDTIGRLDLLRAKGALAIHYKATKPIIEDGLKVQIKDARHPEVMAYLEKRGKSFVPISMQLVEGVTILTGANMGGKSVALKTMILNILLAHMGFFVFAGELRFGLFEYICFVSDDMQSISRGISTFGAEILRINAMVEGIKQGKSFVILDEFARGTNPHEGALLVRALCKYLKEQHAISLLATHYDGIVDKGMTHYQVIGLKHMDKAALRAMIGSDPEKAIGHIQDKMNYNLEWVSEEAGVPQEALTVAELLGLDAGIITIARELGNME